MRGLGGPQCFRSHALQVAVAHDRKRLLDCSRQVAYTRHVRGPAGLEIEIVEAPVELVDADAILLPVDGQICRLGGAVAGAIRRALQPDDVVDEMDFIEDELTRIRPLSHPHARVIEGVARWPKILVSAAYPHNVDGAVFSPDDCAQMIRRAIPTAIALAEDLQINSIAATLIGTAYRMSADLAVRAFVDGLASASKRRVLLRWSLPDASHRQIAEVASKRLSLPIRLK
jgi:O-acetyl-ADP-ribose deacetylase (regulator of RNase III)